MRPRPSLARRFRLAGLLCACIATAAGAEEAPAEPPNWVVSDDGAYVIDRHAKLAWARCVEGMRWNGKTCTGMPQLLPHAQANNLATSRRKNEGLPWRLPRVPELRRLVDKSAKPPGLDPRLFPAAPRDWHWTGTANLNQSRVNPYNYGNIVQGRTTENASANAFLESWAVNLSTGEARGDVPKSSRLPVRLVQPLD